MSTAWSRIIFVPVYKCVYIKCMGRSKEILGLIDLLALQCCFSVGI